MAQAGKRESDIADEREKEGRKLIGQAIIDGLLSPKLGGVVMASNYTQTDGGYWQDGGTHSQGSGDYHQGSGSE